VNVTTGNMYLKQTDIRVPSSAGESIDLTRSYNSMSQVTGMFGVGWSSPYDEKITVLDPRNIRLTMPNGRAIYFIKRESADPFFSATPGFLGTISMSGGTYTLLFKDGRKHHFDSNGKLDWQEDRNGYRTTLSYSGGFLVSVTDPFNRTLSFTNTGGLVTQTNLAGLVANYTYTSGANGPLLQSVTYADGSKYAFEYVPSNAHINKRDKLTTISDYYGNILEKHDYNDDGKATTSEGHTIGGIPQDKYTFDYSNNANNNGFTKVTDGLGRETKYYFDRSYLRQVVKKIEGPCNCGSGSEVTQFFYDNDLYLKKKIDALGFETFYTYDPNKNVTSIGDVLGEQTFEYNSFGQVTRHWDRMRGRTTNFYDTQGNLLWTEDPLGPTTPGDPDDYKTHFGYTTTGIKQLETITDARNNETKFLYDGWRMFRMLDPFLHNTDFEYNGRGQVTSVTNALEEATSFRYDLKNRLDRITYDDKSQVNVVYDLAGRATSVIDENSYETTYAYDEAYRLAGITNVPLSQTTSFGYDSMSNMTSHTDANGNTTDFEYDPFNRLSKIIYPEASSGAARLEESFAYTDIGELETHSDTAGRVTGYAYSYSPFPTPSQSPSATPTPSTMKRVTTITAPAPLNYVTTLTSNARMLLEKVKDARNQEYTFTYDEVGQLKTQSPRVGSTWMTFDYDEVGNRTKRIDYNGHTTDYTYDELNRLTYIAYPGATPQNATYHYDYLSRLDLASNQNGTVTFTYDNRGRLESEEDVWGRLIGYSYDPAGNRTGLMLDGNPHASYQYDEANNLIHLIDDDNGTFDFYYDPGNRLTGVVRPNNVLTSYQYDGMSRLERLTHSYGSFPPTIFYDDQFFYNPANQIHQIKPMGTAKRIYGYDNLDRLTSVSLGGSENYTYDEVGNRLSSLPSGTPNYNYTLPNGAFNRLTGTTSPSANYAYNSNGSRTSKTGGGPASSYGWDRENRLITVMRSGLLATNEYDALGRRVASTYSSAFDEEVNPIRYTYDGLDVVYEDSDDMKVGSKKYQNGPGIDSKLKQNFGGSASYFLQDHLGSTVKMTNSSGSVTESNSYDSFGKPTNPYFSTRYQFTGREYESFSGLQYSRARFYDPQIGRFISEDPIGFAGGDVNLYGYVGNNPVNFSDPFGLSPTFPCWPPSQCADQLDGVINRLMKGIGVDPPIGFTPLNGFQRPIFLSEALHSAVDPLRVGQGVGCAIYTEGLHDYQRFDLIAGDVVRGGELFLTAAPVGIAVRGAVAGAPVGTVVPRVGGPKPSPKFQKPTNPPSYPPDNIPDGWRVRQMRPTQQYPDGYWKLEKPMRDGSWQPIDPSTMKPGRHRWEDHVPFPPGRW